MTTLLLASCFLSGYFTPLPSIEIPIQAPKGWKTEKADGSTILTPDDVPQGKTYVVAITPVKGKAASLDAIFESGKKSIGELGKFKTLTEPKTAQSGGGWDYKLTIGTVEKGEGGFLAEIIGVKKGDDGGVILAIADSLETLQLFSDPFSEMVRSIGGAPKAPAAPEVAASSGTVDLQYTVPAGWTETKKAGVTVIESTKNEFYDKWQWTMIVMPSQPLTGSLADNFKAYWKDLVSANYTSDVVPLPLMARFDNGNVCAFDGDGSAKQKTTGVRPRIVAVHLIAQGDRFVPIFSVIHGYTKQLDADMTRFLETAKIPSASSARVPMFSTADLVGDWKEGSAEIASYVSYSGGYAGDASIFTGNFFHLKSDQSYTHTFMAITATRRLKETDEGKWSVDGEELVCKKASGTDRYSLLGYGVDPKVGRFMVMGGYANQKSKLSLSNPRGVLQASWYRAK